MGKFIVAIAIVGAVVYGFHKGWIQDRFGAWFGRTVDSGISSVKSTQRNATTVRPIDAGAPEEKK
jgi:hypothetical protein